MNVNLCGIRKLHIYFLKVGYTCLLAGLPVCNLLADPTVDQIKSYIMTNIVSNDKTAKEMVQQFELQAVDIQELTKQLVLSKVLEPQFKSQIKGGKFHSNSCDKQLQKLFKVLNETEKFIDAWPVILGNARIAPLAQTVIQDVDALCSSQQGCAPITNLQVVMSALNEPATRFLTNIQGPKPDWPMIGTAFYAVRKSHEELVILLKKNSHYDRAGYLAGILQSASESASVSPNYLAAEILLKLHELFEDLPDSDYKRAVKEVVSQGGIGDFYLFSQRSTGTYSVSQEYLCMVRTIADFFVEHARKFKGLFFIHLPGLTAELKMAALPSYRQPTLENLITYLHHEKKDFELCGVLHWLSQAAYGVTGMRSAHPSLKGMADESVLKERIISVVTTHGTLEEKRCILLYTNGLIAPGSIWRKPYKAKKQRLSAPTPSLRDRKSDTEALAERLSQHSLMENNIDSPP